MSLSKFGFTCGGKRTTGDTETSRNKKAKYDAYKERQNEYEKRRVRSFQQPWCNEFPWVRHTVITDTNGAEKKIMFCEVCQRFPKVSDTKAQLFKGTDNFKKQVRRIVYIATR